MRPVLIMVVTTMVAGCATTPTGPAAVREVQLDEVLITGDLELEKLNDEELFAQGTAAFAAEDHRQAARYFGRLVDFFPDSIHRRAALYNAGLAEEKLENWAEAEARFAQLADAATGTGDALDAAFRLAEVLYHQERYPQAVELLRTIADRPELSANRRVEARVQQGICELESGQLDTAERTLRGVVTYWQGLPDPDLVDDYFPAQAQFFLGEIFRSHYESVKLDPQGKTTDRLAQDLEYKSELLLSAQGHYLRAIRVGNGYWATASGQRIGSLYENLYQHMTTAPAPAELSAEEQQAYRSELRKRIRVLITKAITVYERTLEAAGRIGAASPFVQQTREALQRMKDLLLAEAKADESEADRSGAPGSPGGI